MYEYRKISFSKGKKKATTRINNQPSAKSRHTSSVVIDVDVFVAVVGVLLFFFTVFFTFFVFVVTGWCSSSGVGETADPLICAS